MPVEFHKHLLHGFVYGVFLMGVESLFNGIGWSNVMIFLLVGITTIVFGKGADGVWKAMFSDMVRPFSWYAVSSRIPFWFFAGGIGYVVVLVAAKKIGWISLNEIPVKQFFHTGGIVYCFLQTLVQWRIYRTMNRDKRV